MIRLPLFAEEKTGMQFSYRKRDTLIFIDLSVSVKLAIYLVDLSAAS
jgi:hypothetical protein